MFKYSEFMEIDTVRNVMGSEQRDKYVMEEERCTPVRSNLRPPSLLAYPTLTLCVRTRTDELFTAIMFATVFGAFGLLATITVIQAGEEARRMRRDARHAQSRRLRDKTTHDEVEVPELPEELVYHTFLSHVPMRGLEHFG